MDLKVAEFMTKTLITVEPETSLKEAARVMSTNKIRRLPVIKNNKLVGIVVASDLYEMSVKRRQPKKYSMHWADTQEPRAHRSFSSRKGRLDVHFQDLAESF